MPLHNLVPPEPEPPVSGNARQPSRPRSPYPARPTGMAFLHRRSRVSSAAGADTRLVRPGVLGWASAWADGPNSRHGRALSCAPEGLLCGDRRDDAEGALLLAVVPLPTRKEMEDDGVENWR